MAVTQGRSVRLARALQTMGKIADALVKLVLSLGHSVECAALTGPACTCGKVGRLRDAHGEACSLLRETGHLK